MDLIEPSTTISRVLFSILTLLPALFRFLRPVAAAAQAPFAVAPTGPVPSWEDHSFAWHGLVIGAFAVAAVLLGGPMAQAQEIPAQDLAAPLRVQGYRCDEPVTAQRDAQLSSPDEAVWNLRCRNASYRMRLIPDLAARIEQVE
jgi:hypothetical protein